MPDEFGGVAVEDEPVRDEFGGVALGPGEQPARDEFGGVAEEEAPSAWSGVPGVRATMTPGGGFSIGSAELAQARREARLLAESRAAEPESLRPVLRPPRTDENATLAPTIEEAQSQRIVQETVGPLADRAEEFKELYFAPLGGETPKLGEDWILKAGVSPQARAYRTLVAGGERSVAKVLDFARSPFGLETLGLGMVPGVGRAIAVGFIGDMIAHAPDIGARFVEAVAEGDGLGATEAAADALLTGVFVKGLGRAGFGKYGKAPLTELPGMVKADLPQARARLADALTRLYDVNRPVAGRQAGADVERPTIELDPAAPLTRTVPEPEFNEFGGETTVPETPLAGIPPTPSKPATDEIGTLKDPPEPVVAPEVTETTEVTRRRAIQRVTARRKIDRETEQFGPDVIDWLADNGGVISRAQAKRLGRLATNRDLWDGQPEALAAKHHEFIYETSEHGMMPDEAATGAAEAGVIKTAKVDSLWDAVDRASKARVAQQKQLAAEEAELTRQGAAALKQAKAVQGLLFEIRNAPTPETVERILQRPDAQGIYQAAGEAGQETLDAATRERVGSEQVSERVSGKVGESLRQFAERLEDLKKAPDDKLYAMGFGGVGRAVFNTALDLAAAALRAGAPLAEAVEKALAHIRANFRGEWSEATARLEL
ncbi:MAG: hypothetical protein HW378_171, partial [Anaerolineales bacterium]|nr:hypothetical protein [Anaerolineales bacterium]